MIRIYNLNNIPTEIHSVVGGKARGLSLLNQYGFSVPAGFVVLDIENDEDYAIAAKEYTKQNLGVVAVRSSATLEDGLDFSSAGQFSTFLNVKDEASCEKAIRDCVASLHNETALTYAKNFLSSAQSKMTVVVQQMVDAKIAGVVFTHAPNDKEAILIEAVLGLGESLVSGKTTAQQYLVKTGICNMPENAYLSDTQVAFLAQKSQLAEEKYGMPMDLEWAIDKDDKVQWLQARPITIEDVPDINELDFPYPVDNCVFTTSNIREVMPNATTPLTLSTNMLSLDFGIRQMMFRIGVIDKIDDIPPYSCICSYYNNMFFNMTNMYRFCHTTFGAFKSTMELSICGKPLDEFPDIDMPESPFFRKVRNSLHFFRIILNCSPAIKTIKKLGEDLHFDLTQSKENLYNEICEKMHYLDDAQFCHYWASFYSGSPCNTLVLLLKNDFESLNDLQAKLAGSLTEIDDIESVDVLRSMRLLARTLIEEKPEIVNYNSEEIEQCLVSLSGESKKKYDAFMKRHGHRGVREPEMRSLPWSKDSKALADYMKKIIATGGEEQKMENQKWMTFADDLLYNCNPLKKKLFFKLILRARKGVRYREFTKSQSIVVLVKFKEAYHKLSELMVKDGVLPDTDLIYFLKHEEIGELLKGKKSLIKKAIARRRMFPEQSSLRFNENMMGKPQPKKRIQIDPNSVVYTGTPVSRGIARGKARVIHSIEDANELKSGEIMIAGSTDIGWSPYYSTINGLVTEIGSSLSHGIVVAREYALPSVVNVEDITQIIHTGDLITVDGNSGQVIIEKRVNA